MKKGKVKALGTVVFKKSKRDEQWLFPPNLGSLIPEDHGVRFIDSVVDELDISEVYATYKGGGASSYHPRMLIKLLVYGYLDRIYSSRRLEQQCKENICYMWLCGMQQPDHGTINGFRLGRLETGVKEMFGQVVRKLYKSELIELETQVVDGTKMESVANRYTYVWYKNLSRFKGGVEDKIKGILSEIDEHIKQEQNEDKEEDKKESSPTDDGGSSLSSQEVESRVEELKEVDDEEVNKRIKEIEHKHLPRLKGYEEQEEVIKERNSYSKTDPDASFMRMKDDHLQTGQLKPGYNILLSSENQFIINYSVHQNANDASCYISHTDACLELLESQGLPIFTNANGDSIFGTEENYEYLEKHMIGNFLKYPSFHPEQKKKYKENPFLQSNLYYNEQEDFFVCPMGQKLEYVETQKRQRKSGYEATIRRYEAKNCTGCPMKSQCTKAKGNRILDYNPNLERHKTIAKNNLDSEKGLAMRSKRGVDVEPIFGHFKYNRHYNRLHLRGIPMIEVHLGIMAIAHNLKKMMKILQNDKNTLKNWKLNQVLSLMPHRRPQMKFAY